MQKHFYELFIPIIINNKITMQALKYRETEPLTVVSNMCIYTRSLTDVTHLRI